MKRILATAMLSLAISVAPLTAQTVKMTEEAPGLLKKATIKPEVATATAMAKVPNGKLQTSEIEMEDGKLVYSFAIKVPGKTGIEEVGINAMTGVVIAVEHETPADEAKEAKADKAKATKPKTPPAKPAKPPV